MPPILLPPRWVAEDRVGGARAALAGGQHERELRIASEPSLGSDDSSSSRSGITRLTLPSGVSSRFQRLVVVVDREGHARRVGEHRVEERVAVGVAGRAAPTRDELRKHVCASPQTAAAPSWPAPSVGPSVSYSTIGASGARCGCSTIASRNASAYAARPAAAAACKPDEVVVGVGAERAHAADAWISGSGSVPGSGSRIGGRSWNDVLAGTRA